VVLGLSSVRQLGAAGAVTGGVTGAAVGSMRGLNKDQTEALDRTISSYLQDNIPQQMLIQALNDRTVTTWRIVEPPADIGASKNGDVNEMNMEI